MDRMEHLEQYRTSAARTRSWLDAHFADDGSFLPCPDDSRFYYKAPYALALGGLRAKGARVAKYVLDHFVDGAGNLTGAPDFSLEERLYGMGWLAFGAVATERFDLSAIVARRLAEMQDSRCGGFLFPDSDAGEEVAEVCFSAAAGMGLSAAGKLDPARSTADRLVALLDAQPDPGRFYNRFRPDGSVVARPDAGPWKKMYDLELDEQRPANFATVVAALVWTGRVTSDRRYLDAARRYVELVYRHRLDPARFGRASKFGFAMLQLYEDTGEVGLLDRARRLGDVLLEHQSADGLWDPRPAGPPAPPHVRLSAAFDCAVTMFALANLPARASAGVQG
jgi:hypothetical protein